MLTSALNAPFSPALITAIPRTTALWTAFWWALMKQIPLRISVLTASPSARDDRVNAAAIAAAFSFTPLDGKMEKSYDS